MEMKNSSIAEKQIGSTLDNRCSIKKISHDLYSGCSVKSTLGNSNEHSQCKFYGEMKKIFFNILFIQSRGYWDLKICSSFKIMEHICNGQF